MLSFKKILNPVITDGCFSNIFSLHLHACYTVNNYLFLSNLRIAGLSITGPSLYSPACVGGLYLTKFLIRNLSYSPI